MAHSNKITIAVNVLPKVTLSASMELLDSTSQSATSSLCQVFAAKTSQTAPKQQTPPGIAQTSTATLPLPSQCALSTSPLAALSNQSPYHKTKAQTSP